MERQVDAEHARAGPGKDAVQGGGRAAAGGKGEQRPRDQHAGDEQPAHRQRQQHVAAQQQAAGGAAPRALFAQGAEHPAVEDQVERKEDAERQPGQLMKQQPGLRPEHQHGVKRRHAQVEHQPPDVFVGFRGH